MDNIKFAFSEVDEIINFMSSDLRSKIPQEFIKLIKEKKDKEYKPKIERGVPLEEQSLSEETIGILAFLKLNCFCDEIEKKKFIKLLNENEREFQNEFSKKYKVDDILNKTEVKEDLKTVKAEIQIVNNRKNIFTKIKNMIYRMIQIKK